MIALILLGVGVALVAAAEWPRLQERFGLEARADRQRQKRKAHLRIVTDTPEPETTPPETAEDFAASVQRDLENLPVVDPHDDRS